MKTLLLFIPSFKTNIKVSFDGETIEALYQLIGDKIANKNKEKFKFLLKTPNDDLATSLDQITFDSKEKFKVELLPDSSNKALCFFTIRGISFFVLVGHPINSPSFIDDCLKQVQLNKVKLSLPETTKLSQKLTELPQNTPFKPYFFVIQDQVNNSIRSLNNETIEIKGSSQFLDSEIIQEIKSPAGTFKQNGQERPSFMRFPSFLTSEITDKVAEIGKLTQEVMKLANLDDPNRKKEAFYFDSEQAELHLTKSRRNPIMTIKLLKVEVPKEKSEELTKNYLLRVLLTSKNERKRITIASRISLNATNIEDNSEARGHVDISFTGGIELPFKLENLSTLESHLDKFTLSFEIYHKKGNDFPKQEFRFKEKGQWGFEGEIFKRKLRSEIREVIENYFSDLKN